MKTIHLILLILGLLIFKGSNAQTLTEQLKQFNENADMDCYLAKIEDNINDHFRYYNEILRLDQSGIPPQHIEINKDEIVPMLTIQFVNTDTFNFNDNIYNYITIDTSIVFTLAIVDNRKNVIAFANSFACGGNYDEIKKDPSLHNLCKRLKLKHVIKRIKKQKPELILYSDALSGWIVTNGGWFWTYGFMYIKNDKIYVYRVMEKEIYELNDYLRRFYSLENTRNLNHRFVPLVYQTDSTEWRSGYTPENKKIICP